MTPDDIKRLRSISTYDHWPSTPDHVQEVAEALPALLDAAEERDRLRLIVGTAKAAAAAYHGKGVQPFEEARNHLDAALDALAKDPGDG